MGASGSSTWLSMLDAAEDILREEGHATLSSRAVAERLGLKQRLVYYYFSSMDELIVETFRRLSTRELARLTEALDDKRPLWAIWDLCVHTTDTRLVSEFMALANRIESLRHEVAAFIEESRSIQVAAITRAMADRGEGDMPAPAALALLATSAALSLQREAALGIRTGHAEITALIGGFISKWDRSD
jgi:AcrR family transcriptional regulator